MKFYLDSDRDSLNIVQSVASASTMISSLASEARSYILSKFPKNYFKHIYIDTAQTVSEQHVNDRYNKAANKIPYPSMSITPEISLDDPIGAMQKALHLSSPNIYLRKDLNRSYKKILIDPDDRFGMFYTSDYITTNFNFKIVTNSFIQNADVAFYLQSRFQKDFFQFLNERYIQTEIPKTFIRMIADIKDWDLNKQDEMNQLRLFLIGTSKTNQYIIKRTSLTTGKVCFFLNEKQNLLSLFTDLDCPSSINRDSQVESEYTINFRLQVSAWLPNSFIFNINKYRFEDLSQTTKDSIKNESDLSETGLFSNFNFSMDNVLSKKDTINFEDSSGAEQIGQLVYSDTYIYDTQDESFPDINIIKLLPKEIIDVYRYGHNKLNLNMSSMLHVVASYGSNILHLTDNKDEIISLDYDTLRISINGSLDFEELKIGIYINRLAFESIRKAMKKDLNFFSSNYLTFIMSNIAGRLVKLVVKSFVNEKEKYSSDPMKSLRVETPYGIGYISLKNEGKRPKSAYKVCVGFDDNGDPIIKEIETQQ